MGHKRLCDPLTISDVFFLWEVDTAPKHVQLKWSLSLHTLHNWSFSQCNIRQF